MQHDVRRTSGKPFSQWFYRGEVGRRIFWKMLLQRGREAQQEKTNHECFAVTRTAKANSGILELIRT